MIRSVLGSRASIGGVLGSGRGGAAAAWWLSGGVSAANCVAAYTPKGAASLAASYDNNAAPGNGLADGTYDAAPGVAPTWAAATGWYSDGTKYLNTGVLPNANYSVIVRFSGMQTNAYKTMLGSFTDTNRWLDIGHYTIPASSILMRNGNTNWISGGGANLAAGTYAIAGQSDVYINGVGQSASLGTWSGGAGTRPIWIFGLNVGSLSRPISGYIQAVAIYNTTLSAAQVAAISAAMAAL